MIVNIPSSYSMKSVPLDTEKEYVYERNKGQRNTEKFIVKPKLQKYNDGEGYGCCCHYGYVMIVVKTIRKYYNNPSEGYDVGTAPDLCEQLTEVKK